MNRQTLAVVIPLSVATMTSGCSIFFVKGPTGAEPANCTDTYGWPALDMGLTLLEGVRTGLAINASDQAYANAKLTHSQDVALGVGLASWAAISAVIGFARASDCREAVEAARVPDPAIAEAAVRRYRRLQKEREQREQQAAARPNPPGGGPPALGEKAGTASASAAAAPGSSPTPGPVAKPITPSPTRSDPDVPMRTAPSTKQAPGVKQLMDDE